MWSGKCTVGEMSGRGNVLVGKCPVGEVSGRGIVRSGKCPFGEVSVGELFSRGTVRIPFFLKGYIRHRVKVVVSLLWKLS